MPLNGVRGDEKAATFDETSLPPTGLLARVVRARLTHYFRVARYPGRIPLCCILPLLAPSEKSPNTDEPFSQCREETRRMYYDAVLGI